MACGSCSSGADGAPGGCQSKGSCGTGSCNRMNVHDWLANLPFSDPESTCKIVELSFNQGSRKDYFKNTTNQYFEKGDLVAVEGVNGFDVGMVNLTGELVRLQLKKHKIDEKSPDLKKILRIGARQEAGKVGGIGSCGRELCCSTWLTDFKSVNTNAARYQNLSINQTKLSGQCGRLKCCLNYELDTYMDALQFFPNNVDMLETAKGRAFLVKKDIFKNLMWYTMADSNMHYPLTIDTVKKIKAQNKEGIKPEELETAEIVTGKPKEIEPEYADIVGRK